MKKIVTLGAIAVLSAGFMFADEPAADVSITEFNGNAKVTWGFDLDAGKTGFENKTEANFKVKLFNGGEKVTEGDGIWAELKVKTDGLKWEGNIDKGEWKDGKASLETAKLHINDFYVDIKSGDAVLGEYKFDGAIRSADADQAKWIKNVGPADYKNGIQVGYDTSDLAIKADLRSFSNNTPYTNSYAVALEAGLKDSNQWLKGLFANGGIAYNLSGEYYHGKDLGKEDDLKDGKKQYEIVDGKDTLQVKQKAKSGDSPVERVWFGSESAKKFADALFDEEFAPQEAALKTAGLTDEQIAKAKAKNGFTFQNGHVFGYALNAGYKLALDDKYFVKPTVAFAGSSDTSEFRYGDNKWGKTSGNANDVAFGVILGWGSVADDNAGVAFLDGDPAKKVQPGVSVVVDIPLAATATISGEKTYKSTTHDKVLAYIVPSFYTKGDLVEGLSAGVYSEIALLNYKSNPDKKAEEDYQSASYTKKSGETYETWNNAAFKDEKFALALAAGVKYDIKSGDITVTPRGGFRFANTAYVDNGINGKNPLSEKKVFDGMGTQKEVKKVDANGVKDKKYGLKEAAYLNIKAGVDVTGLINNTTFSLDYVSANLLNKTDYTSKEVSNRDYLGVNADGNGANPNYNDGWKFYNVKLGTLNVGCKISF